LIFTEVLKRIAPVFRGSSCPSGIAGKALDHSQRHLITAFGDLRSKVELSQSELQ